VFDEVIEASLPAECPCDNLSRQRPVALVLEILAARVQRGRQVRAAGADCPNR
jgi:hypothetical protein